MKIVSWKILVLFVVSALFAGCAPVNTPISAPVADTWTANIGKVSFMQEGTKITGAIEGYGGQWKEGFEGTLTDNQAVFHTEWFGDFTLVFEGDTFKSTSPDLAFCGIRSSEEKELPAGCGFSGQWNIPDKPGFPAGSTIELKQIEEMVTGTIYSGDGEVYDTVSGTVYWGKGWRMEGTTENLGTLSLDINSAETGFMIVTEEFPVDKQLCAVREGQTSAYLMFYSCE